MIKKVNINSLAVCDCLRVEWRWSSGIRLNFDALFSFCLNSACNAINMSLFVFVINSRFLGFFNMPFVLLWLNVVTFLFITLYTPSIKNKKWFIILYVFIPYSYLTCLVEIVREFELPTTKHNITPHQITVCACSSVQIMRNWFMIIRAKMWC